MAPVGTDAKGVRVGRVTRWFTAPSPSFFLFLEAPSKPPPYPPLSLPFFRSRYPLRPFTRAHSPPRCRVFSSFFFFFFFSQPLRRFSTITCVYIYIYPVSRSTHGFVGSWGYGFRRISIFGEQEEEEEVVTDNYGDRDLSGGVFEVLELELLTSVTDLSFATFVILVIRLRKKVFRRDFLRLILSSSVVCSVSLSSKTKDKSMNKWFVRPVNRFEKRLEEVWRGARWLISEVI